MVGKFSRVKDRERRNSWMIEFPGRNFQRQRAKERERQDQEKINTFSEQLEEEKKIPIGKLHIVCPLENYSYLTVVYFLPVLFDHSGELQHG